SFVHKLVQAKSAFGTVIDADGLNALAQTIISHDAGMAGDRPPPYSSTTSKDDVAEDRPTPYSSKTSRDDVAEDRPTPYSSKTSRDDDMVGDRPPPYASGTVARGPVPRALSNTNTVFTPHPGEMARLIGKPIFAIEADRIGTAQQFAQEWGVTLLLKGAPTVTACADGGTWIN
ncbi:hypothetical protein C6495_02400, partial [Candidatus Poribacteria bacterium]